LFIEQFVESALGRRVLLGHGSLLCDRYVPSFGAPVPARVDRGPHVRRTYKVNLAAAWLRRLLGPQRNFQMWVGNGAPGRKRMLTGERSLVGC
jgi:hypothetical protein